MALEYHTTQFANDEEGLRQRNLYNAKMANAGWWIVSEGIEQGKFKGDKACCLFFIFPPLAFLAGRAAGVVTITFARETTRSGGFCSSCGDRLPNHAAFCMRCGARCTSTSEALPQNVKEQIAPTKEVSTSGCCASCGIGSELHLSDMGFFCPVCLAKHSESTVCAEGVHYGDKRPLVPPEIVETSPQQFTTDTPRHSFNRIEVIVPAIVVVLCLVGWGIAISDRPGIPEPSAVAATTSSSDSVPFQPSTAHVILNLPKLAFAPLEEVGRVLGKPSRVTVDHNSVSWSEGEVIEAIYRRAECSFLSGRLIAITYTFAKTTRPTTVTEELAACGLPKRAASLSSFPPYLAMYPSNPLRCCGLAFHLVSIPEDFSSIWVVFANMNLHFQEWPSETQEGWRRAGGPKLSTNPLDWPFVTKKRPH